MKQRIINIVQSAGLLISTLYVGMWLTVLLLHRSMPGKMIVNAVLVSCALSPLTLSIVAIALGMHLRTHREVIRSILVGMLLLLGLIGTLVGTYFLWQFTHSSWSL